MAKDRHGDTSIDSPSQETRRVRSPEAQRALAEAELRRKIRDDQATAAPREIDGRQGPDPVRYGDWENKGIASDF